MSQLSIRIFKEVTYCLYFMEIPEDIAKIICKMLDLKNIIRHLLDIKTDWYLNFIISTIDNLYEVPAIYNHNWIYRALLYKLCFEKCYIGKNNIILELSRRMGFTPLVKNFIDMYEYTYTYEYKFRQI